jgi:hypothetical protein
VFFDALLKFLVCQLLRRSGKEPVAHISRQKMIPDFMGCILPFHLIIVSDFGKSPESVGILDQLFFNGLRIIPGIMPLNDPGNFIDARPVIIQLG